MTHALKTWPEFYESIESGEKNFELRKFDRPFTVGDTLILQEWDPGKAIYTGKERSVEIGYILSDVPPEFGLIKGFCILGFKEGNDY